MSTDNSSCDPKVYFYIGGNDSEDEDEGFKSDSKLFSTSCIPLLAHIWYDIGRWEEGQDPPLKLAMEMLRILHGLGRTTQVTKESLAHYNTYLNQRVAKASTALKEYRERLCAQVDSILEEREQQDLSEMKEEIMHFKKQIQNAKRISNRKDHIVRKRLSFLTDLTKTLDGTNQLKTELDLEAERLNIIIPQKKRMDRRVYEKEEEEEEDPVKCLNLCKLHTDRRK
ncbi:uncharacterized protein LOC142489334 [Ascaphus truei]|uniref:uncharacterized protein LOC142489334 n=1 Tax=Ascaphus truei TaxID=8439 RepID=UPI003F5A3FDE